MADETRCDHCGRPGEDAASISVDYQEWGFCSLAHMVLFVRARWIEVVG